MLHAYVERFDVMGERGNILGWDVKVNEPSINGGYTHDPLSTRKKTSFSFLLYI
jgi:hypothetical protein